MANKKAYASPDRYQQPEDRKGGKFEDYEIRGALTTLVTAAKIRKNAALMRLVRQEARKQAKVALKNAETV